MISSITWHGRSDQQFDLTLLLLHGLLQILKEESLHIADHLPEEGQRGRDGVHTPLTWCSHKIHDQTHLTEADLIRGTDC